MRSILIIALTLVGCSERVEIEDTRSIEEIRGAVETAMKSEDYRTAEKELSVLIDRGDDAFSALAGRAVVRIFLGDAMGAESDFDAAIGIEPQEGEKMELFVADRSIWRAREMDMKERHAEALRIYDALITLYPDLGMAYHDRGGLKTDMKDYEGAIADLTKAIQCDTGNNSFGDSYILRARARRATGDEPGALEDEAQAKELSDSRQN